MKKKINAQKNTGQVLFSLPPEAVEGANTVMVLGDFSEWKPILLIAQTDGSYEVEIEIPLGRDYHFRYLLDDRWENDWAADRYDISPIHDHVYNSVVCLIEQNSTKEKAKATTSEKPKKNENSVDDLTKIEGIGPQIAELMKADGIVTFEQLSKAKEKSLKEILDKGGKRFQIHNPSTWAAQAKLAAKGDWDALKKWQDELKGGKAE